MGNFVLRPRPSSAVKRDFRTYIRRYTSPNEIFEYGYPHSNALPQFHLHFEPCKPHLSKGDEINDVKLVKQFPTVYRRIFSVANFRRYPIRSRITKASALDFIRILVIVRCISSRMLLHVPF